jgi:hypothetical protein
MIFCDKDKFNWSGTKFDILVELGMVIICIYRDIERTEGKAEAQHCINTVIETAEESIRKFDKSKK